MAGVKEFPNGTIQYVVKKAGLLDKPLYFTFNSRAEGDPFIQRLEKLLEQGIVPTEYQAKSKVKTVEDLVRVYTLEAHPSAKDVDILATVLNHWGSTSLVSINVDWVDAWIASMKHDHKLAPDTIRKKVGALARCTDWGIRRKLLLLPDQPLRTLPQGYSQYNKRDEDLAGVARVDVERDRRLEKGENEKVLALLDVGVLPRKQRPLKLEHVPALRCMFLVAQDSAMRLREMYTLTLDQLDFTECTIFLDKTKNGHKRQVPMASTVVDALKEYLRVRVVPEGGSKQALFPWWDGTPPSPKAKKYFEKLTSELSKLFVDIFESAGCRDLGFHDLRHEATSRLFERTNLSDTEIMKITGHSSVKMLLRYANLRGSKLAARLW